MLPHVTRGVRVALVLALSTAYIGWHSHAAYAKGGGDDDSAGDDDDDDGGGGGGDKKGGDDDDDDDSGNDKDQPPVTAGGLFTLKTYPKNENLRPLTITHGITQLRLSVGTDLSAKGAFKSIGVNLEGEYGLRDNFEIFGGFTNAYNFQQFSVYAGIEGAIVYDLFDFRVAANVQRFAYSRFCGDGSPDQPASCDTNSIGLPDGNYYHGGTQFSIDLGFPFRYAFKPQIALVALQTLMSIDFNGSQIGNPNNRMAGAPAYCDGVGSGSDGSALFADPNNCIENSATPDFDPSVGVAISPIPQISITAFAQLRIVDFDTSAGNFQIPVTLRVEATPTNRLDFGLQFELLNVTPPAPQGAVDNRFLSLYAQYRL